MADEKNVKKEPGPEKEFIMPGNIKIRANKDLPLEGGGKWLAMHEERVVVNSQFYHNYEIDGSITVLARG